MNTIEQSTATSLGRRDVFDKLFGLITKHDDDFVKSFPLENFYDYVSDLENALQDVNESEFKNKKILNNFIDEVLLKFISVFEVIGFRDEPLFYGFKRFLRLLAYVVKNSYNVENFGRLIQFFNSRFTSLNKIPNGLDFSIYSHRNSISEIIPVLREKFSREILNSDLLRVLRNNHEFSDIYWKSRRSKPGEQHIDNGEYVSVKDGYYTEVNLYVKDEVTSKIFAPAIAIISSLEKIKGNSIIIDKLQHGSLEIEMTIWSDDLVAKEETKSFLKNTAQKVIDGIEKKGVNENPLDIVNQAQAAVAELKNIATEDITRDEGSIAPGAIKPKAKRASRAKTIDEKLKEAELELKLLEVEKMRNEVAKGRLDLFKELSDIAANEILAVDHVGVGINQVYSILKVHNDIEASGNIDQAFD